ncbi:MAG TPA: patatin-like phospholipase family protein [Methylibium sp.]|uniref:patatin-like phospholipase family protein n=1 Tax=Methylibium sp. TaxID=2067992 RepID=UPI002DBEA67C|nr:patatin-like phospholipase family protein [Methylibium sp.]HEU4458868.1 patatin-like phospholipase family protein [Methylibium sp.]
MATMRQRLMNMLRRKPAHAPHGPHPTTPASRPAPRPPKRPGRVDLALQGGGSHGAFTWGVLDRLLEDDALEIGAVSGTSAGALNAAVLATGLANGGAPAARDALAAFWHDVSREGQIFAPFSRGSNGAPSPGGFGIDDLPSYRWFSSFFRAFSPYEFNPLNLNPLRDVARRHIDEEALRKGGLPLFIAATSVTTGQARVFTGRELSIDVLLASACLPMTFQAVEIDGEPYWDGGYTGNPAIYPLIYQTEALDILLVRINPLKREGTPRRAEDILDRISEITFNASLIAEMRAIAFVSRLVREGKLDAGRYKDLRLHMIADDAGLTPLGANSKMNTDRAFLEQLHTLGRIAARDWQHRHLADVGVKSSFDVERVFLAKHGRTLRGGSDVARAAPK